MPETPEDVNVYAAPAGTPAPDGDPADAGWLDIGWTSDDGFVTDPTTDPAADAYLRYRLNGYAPGGLVPGPGAFVTEPEFTPYVHGGMAIDFMGYNRDRLAAYLDTYRDTINASVWQRSVTAVRSRTGRLLGASGYHNPSPGVPAAMDLAPMSQSIDQAAAAMQRWVDAARRSVDRDEPTPQPYAARATAPPRPAGDDVDDLTAAIENLCSCPCRRPLDPGGASAYFATADCQRRWHGAQATDPTDVYRRVDAARTVCGPGADMTDPPLTAPPTESPAASPATERPARPVRGRRRPPLGRPDFTAPPGGRAGLTGSQQVAFDARVRGRSGDLAWRRWCERCNTATRSNSTGGWAVTGCRPGPRLSDGTREVRVDTAPDTWQQCADCGHRFPGPNLYAQVDLVDDDDFNFRLTDGTRWVSVCVDRDWFTDEFAGVPGPQREFVDAVWLQLEADLLRRIADPPAGPTLNLFSGDLDEYLHRRRIMYEQRLALSVLPPAPPFLTTTGI